MIQRFRMPTNQISVHLNQHIMKKQNLKKWLGSLLVLLLATSLAAPQEVKAESPIGISFQVFYDELMPYGDWVRDTQHGYIWLPNVNTDFHPYGTEGHWVMTEYGNTWVSYYDWGWAPFHYGRWYFDNYYQSWAWVPDYEWGPAWVNWRTGGGYYGWAPLRPGFSISIGINIPSFHYVFLPRHRIYNHYAFRYFAPRRNPVRIYNNTTIINNTVVYNNNRFVAGPSQREVERVTRRIVPVYRVQESDRAGRASLSRNSVNLYRPDLQSSQERSAEARPSRVLQGTRTRTNIERSTNRPNVATSSRSASSSPRNSNFDTQRSVRSSAPEKREPQFEKKPYQQRSSSNRVDTRVRSSGNTAQKNSVRTQTPQKTSRNSSVSSGRDNSRSQTTRPTVNSSTRKSGSSASRVQSTPSRGSSQKVTKPEIRSSSKSTSPPASKSKTSRSRTSGRGN